MGIKIENIKLVSIKPVSIKLVNINLESIKSMSIKFENVMESYKLCLKEFAALVECIADSLKIFTDET